MDQKNNEITGVVLIGGRSQRFGRDKVIEPFQESTLVGHVTKSISPLFKKIILVGHKREALGDIQVVEDIMPGLGPLGGIYSALCAIKTRYCFVFAADMPRLNPAFIKYMITRAKNAEIIIPGWSRGREPLHAIYSQELIPKIRTLLKKNSLQIFSLLKESDTLFIGENTIRRFGDPERIFANINTLHDISGLTGNTIAASHKD
ncbi:MAG: molybdenum cofactor guanylyltransferase [Thermodesulfobacteriota bacterium]|nr:molybdenum cofactor guanylyltransferase [Thermodesulfobacteriota bacterium]